jgi:enamine deaminase RidA (YjgF/YER057c/UK114 family)
MGPERFNPPDLWQPFGSFAMAVVQGDGRIVHLKGQVALDPAGQVVGPGDMRAQVRQVHENIRTALRALGGDMGDILALTQHITDIEAFMKTGDIRAEFFRPPYPATTTVEIRRLFRPDLVVEITAIAEIPNDRFRRPGERRTGELP